MARDRVLDIVKGIAIVCVVIGHIRTGADLPIPHTRFVYQFHMPLFFFVSGMFYKEAENWFVFLKKKIKRLYIPYVLANLAFLGIFIIKSLVHGEEVIPIDMIKHSVKICLFYASAPLGSPTWFLFVLFFASVFYKIVDDISSLIASKSIKAGKVFEWIVVLSLTAVGLYHKLSFGIGRALVAMLFYHLGRVSCYSVYPRFKEVKNGYKILITIIGIICTYCLSRINWVEMYCSDYGVIPLFLLSSFIGIITSFALSCLIAKSERPSAFLSYAGEKSLWIMIGHMPVLDIIAHIQPTIDNSQPHCFYLHLMWFLVYLIFGVSVPMLVARIKDKLVR